MLKSKIDQVLEQMKEFRTETNKRFDKIEKEQEEFRAETNERFEKIDKRFDKVDKRFDKMDEDHKNFIHAVQVDLLRVISENTSEILNQQDEMKKLPCRKQEELVS